MFLTLFISLDFPNPGYCSIFTNISNGVTYNTLKRHVHIYGYVHDIKALSIYIYTIQRYVYEI